MAPALFLALFVLSERIHARRVQLQAEDSSDLSFLRFALRFKVRIFQFRFRLSDGKLAIPGVGRLVELRHVLVAGRRVFHNPVEWRTLVQWNHRMHTLQLFPHALAPLGLRKRPRSLALGPSDAPLFSKEVDESRCGRVGRFFWNVMRGRQRFAAHVFGARAP